MLIRIPRLPQDEYCLEMSVAEGTFVKKGDPICLLRFNDQAIKSEVEVELDAICDGVVTWKSQNSSLVRVGDIVAEIIGVHGGATGS